MKKNHYFVYDFFKEFIPIMIFALISEVLMTGLYYMIPYIYAKIIDDGITKGNINKLMSFILILIIIYVIVEIFRYLIQKLDMRIRYKMEMKLKTLVLKYLIENSRINKNIKSGRNDSLLNKDVNSFISAFYSVFKDIITNVFALVTAFIILIKMQSLLAAGAIIMQLIVVRIKYIQNKFLERNSVKVRNSMIGFSSITNEIIINLKYFYRMNIGKFAINRYIEGYKENFIVLQKLAFG